MKRSSENSGSDSSPPQPIPNFPKHNSPPKKLKSGVHSHISTQLEALGDWEQRIDSNILQMERMLAILHREKEKLRSEKRQLKELLDEDGSVRERDLEEVSSSNCELS
jgi:hypothetical protein